MGDWTAVDLKENEVQPLGSLSRIYVTLPPMRAAASLWRRNSTTHVARAWTLSRQ